MAHGQSPTAWHSPRLENCQSPPISIQIPPKFVSSNPFSPAGVARRQSHLHARPFHFENCWEIYKIYKYQILFTIPARHLSRPVVESISCKNAMMVSSIWLRHQMFVTSPVTIRMPKIRKYTGVPLLVPRTNLGNAICFLSGGFLTPKRICF